VNPTPDHWILGDAERIDDARIPWAVRYPLLLTRAGRRPFRRLLLDAQRSRGPRHTRESTPRDSLKLGKVEIGASLKLALLGSGTVSLSEVRGSSFASAYWQQLADEHCRVVAVLAGIAAGGETDDLASLVPVDNRAGVVIGQYDPLLGRIHRERGELTVGTLRARAREAYLEAVSPGYHVLRREWRQRQDTALELGSIDALSGKGQAGYGPINSRDDEGEPSVRETIAGDGRDIARRTSRWHRPRKRVWYVGGEDTRDHNALIARMDLRGLTGRFSASDAQMVWMLCVGFGSREIGEALDISPVAARVRLHRIRRYLEETGNKTDFVGRYLVDSCNNAPSLYTTTINAFFSLRPFKERYEARKATEWTQPQEPVPCACSSTSWVRNGLCWNCRIWKEGGTRCPSTDTLRLAA
jgi:hypothetical protein